MSDEDEVEEYWPQSFPEVFRAGSFWRDRPRVIESITKTDDGFIIETKEAGR